RREPAAEADRKHVGIEALATPALLNGAYQPDAEGPVTFPQLVVRDRFDVRPARVLRPEVPPVGPHMALEQGRQLGSDPGGHVDSIGDRVDRDLSFRQSRPGILPEASRDGAVEPADADGVVGHAKPDIGGAEVLVLVAGGAPAQIHEALEAESDFGQVRIEEMAYETGLEVVAPGGNRGVRREDEACPGDQAGLLQGELAALPQFPDPLDGKQEAVALVHVEDGGLDSHGPQRSHAADAQNDLLRQPTGWLRSVEARFAPQPAG